MGSYMVCGILIGLLFGVPVGAVGTLTVQRTFNGGLKAGLVTGLGSSIADCIYACIGAFGLTLISDFLLRYQTVINVLGSAVILLMGIRAINYEGGTDITYKQHPGKIGMFLSSFAVGITNPAAILTFLFAFSYFGITGQTEWYNSIQIVAGIFIGTYVWWGILAGIVCFIKKKAQRYSIQYLNRIFGMVLILFSIIVFIRTFI